MFTLMLSVLPTLGYGDYNCWEAAEEATTDCRKRAEGDDDKLEACRYYREKLFSDCREEAFQSKQYHQPQYQEPQGMIEVPKYQQFFLPGLH
jgi:hypothetical protein